MSDCSESSVACNRRTPLIHKTRERQSLMRGAGHTINTVLRSSHHQAAPSMLWKQTLVILISTSENPYSSGSMQRNTPGTSAPTSSSSSSLPRILCLHGKFQSASSFANKIGGARRKFAREYDLHFLDAPIALEGEEPSPSGNDDARAWWLRDESGTAHALVPEAVDYIRRETRGQEYAALLGFSQGGTLATAMVVSGEIRVRALLTAGAPDAEDVFARIEATEAGLAVPKLHFAGETDDIIPVESTRQLCERAGHGQLVCHEKGHLFPTKAQYVNQMLDFLREHVTAKK